ncbi:PaaI family thioesterase [uncultured Microbulbifer sp.]|uniref:PaaI family thioesterase n=1 Tax=uncultured Microbulbifer sp. TaxID=348147 RepID=UPI00261E2577|nr:PaaI family thioesterase [uncultured Microbulbifer sp.]
MIEQTAIQDMISDNHCFGCGPDNDHGLRIKSYWSGEDKTRCVFTPAAHHSAGPARYLNGGVIATVIDCHTVCTAIADGYLQTGRDIGAGSIIWYATGKLAIRYLAPAAIDKPVILEASIVERSPRKTVLHCDLSSSGRLCAEAQVIAVRVPEAW